MVVCVPIGWNLDDSGRERDCLQVSTRHRHRQMQTDISASSAQLSSAPAICALIAPTRGTLTIAVETRSGSLSESESGKESEREKRV